MSVKPRSILLWSVMAMLTLRTVPRSPARPSSYETFVSPRPSSFARQNAAKALFLASPPVAILNSP